MAKAIAAPTFETITRSIKERGIVDDGRPLHLLMIGPSGVGKSSLAGVLINGVSKGVDGPDIGTTENIKSTVVSATNGSTYIVHDTRGLDGNKDQTQQTIKEMKRVIENEKCIIFVCVRWDNRFANCETTFEVTNELSPDIWEKAVIVLTHSDCLPPTFANLPDDEQDESIEELNNCWEKNIKKKLSRLGVTNEKLEKLIICNTSHTSISKNWISKLFAKLFQVLPCCDNVFNAILTQVGNLYPEHRELADLTVSSLNDVDFTPVFDSLQNLPPEKSTCVSYREIFYGTLATIDGGVSGAAIGGIAGAVLCKHGVIAASVTSGAGVGAGIGLLVGIGIVAAYIFYKLSTKND